MSLQAEKNSYITIRTGLGYNFSTPNQICIQVLTNFANAAASAQDFLLLVHLSFYFAFRIYKTHKGNINFIYMSAETMYIVI